MVPGTFSRWRGYRRGIHGCEAQYCAVCTAPSAAVRPCGPYCVRDRDRRRALTGIFLVLFSGYCEDVGYCSPKWWVFVGLALLGVAIVLGGLMGRAIREYSRVA